MFKGVKLLKTNEFINDKIDNLNISSFSIKIINNVYNKIALLRNFEKIYNIEPFNFEFQINNKDVANKLTDNEFIKYQKIFRSKKKKPENVYNLQFYYKQMIDNIVGNNLPIIITKRIRYDMNKQKRIYKINKNLILQLYNISIRQSNNNNYDNNLLKIINN